MSYEQETDTPTQCVNVYEGGRLVAQVMCESTQEAAEVTAEWEERTGVSCQIGDLGGGHGPDDVLAPEPEDALDDDEYRSATS
jgi:hypothetical protein